MKWQQFITFQNKNIQGITTGKTAFSIANGHVQGTIDTLNSDLTSSIANGHNEIVVKKITQENNEAIRINMAIANGHNAIELVCMQVPYYRTRSKL